MTYTVPLDFMQPELLDQERAEWPTLDFEVVDLVGPSGHTTVRVEGPEDDLRAWLTIYADEDQELVDLLIDE